MTKASRVLIVGGGIAGWTVATSLREGGFDGTVAIVEHEPACYDRPPLSKAALIDGAPMQALAFADETKFTELQIEVLLGRSVTHLDHPKKEARLDNGDTFAYDLVVLATGAAARRPAFSGADLPGVMTLRNFTDAAALRSFAGQTVAVVGAGLIGAEATAALRQLNTEVILIDPNEVPGTRVFGATMAEHLHAMHAANGVDVRTDTIMGISQAGENVHLTLGGGETIEANVALVGAGITVDTELARGAGVEVAAAILVDECGRTSVPGIFAAGDAAQHRVPAGKVTGPRGHWESAQIDGQAVAAAILGHTATERKPDWFWSDRYGHHIEVVGELAGPGQEVVRPGVHPTVFRVDGGLLVGASSVDDPNAVRASRRLIDLEVAVTSEQLSDPAVSLRSLLPKISS